MERLTNYIGVFLTFRCRLRCDYCLNRQGEFAIRNEIPAEKWLEILKDVETREDLPISLQGGEPTLYGDFYKVVQGLHKMGKKIDLLTNGMFRIDDFVKQTRPVMFSRNAPYASIRFSLHKNTDGPNMIAKVNILRKMGYSVGVWGIEHPDMLRTNAIVRKVCEQHNIDYREKEYLDAENGTYKYPDAVTGKKNITVECFPSERLFAPDGTEYHCHHNLYAGKPEVWNPGGSMSCDDYGLCNPCDIKLKTNRLQIGGHCSMKIKKGRGKTNG